MNLKEYCLKSIEFAGKSLFVFFCFIFFIFMHLEVFASDAYDEVPVLLTVQRVGSVEISIIIYNQEAYLPVSDVFDFLKIKNSGLRDVHSISGFFIGQDALYHISKTTNNITFLKETYELHPEDLIQTSTGLYLKLSYFGKVFGLNGSFNFRSLSIVMKTDHDLPVIRERRLEEMRLNMMALKDEFKADTIIGRSNSLFRMGMADWLINSTQNMAQKTGEFPGKNWNYTRLNLSLGAVIAGGETNLNLNYIKDLPFNLKGQNYLWRYVKNDNPTLRQVSLGRINSQATSSILSPLIGVQLSNASTNNRKSFGSYTLSDFTEPNWIVELYINNQLVGYVQADNNGFYTFDVPLLYGNTSVKLHFYGPWGDEHTIEKNISIPFNFLPPNEIEYTVSAGVLEDYGNSNFYRSNFNYGLNKFITIGGGVEYLSTIKSRPYMPFFNTSIRLAPRLILSKEYTHGVRAKGILTYQHASNLNAELMFARYRKDQKAIFYSFLEERRAVVSKQFRAKNFNFFSQFIFHQIIFPTTTNTRAELMFSGSVLRVATRITNTVLINGNSKPYFFSNLALSHRLPAKLNVIIQAQYEHNRSRFVSWKTGLEKNISRNAFITFTHEQNLAAKTKSIEVGFIYNFSFSHTTVRARFFQNNVMIMESARGGINYNPHAKPLAFNTITNVGQGGITLIPFLDLNNNGKRDRGEPKVSGLNPSINGGSFAYHEKDSTYSIASLRPYMDYFIKLDQNKFQSISWQIKDEFIQISVEPNHFKRVEIPVSISGEVSGMVYDGGTTEKKGIARIKINFYNNEDVFVGTVLSEGDGYFSYFGLPSGSYTARVDSEQMNKISMVALPAAKPFKIENSREGDFVDDLEFFLKKVAD